MLINAALVVTAACVYILHCTLYRTVPFYNKTLLVLVGRHKYLHIIFMKMSNRIVSNKQSMPTSMYYTLLTNKVCLLVCIITKKVCLKNSSMYTTIVYNDRT